jgi:recombination DNA repair RAD52 pathway protein
MNRELLEKPFDPEQIKQREGNFGKMLEYIEGHAIIQRLNDAFEAEWSFSILKHEILIETDEVIVLGELRSGDVIKTQFGSSRITRNRETGDIISLAGDFKAAGTDALKKCATLLGIGLHLYNGDKPGHQNNVERTRSNSGSRNANRGNGNRNGRLTGKQYKYIVRLNDELGRSKAELDTYALELFGTVVQHLSKSDASALINHLLTQ